MKQFTFLIVFAFMCSQTIAADVLDYFDEAMPIYPFYSDGVIKNCPSCETFTISITENAPSRQVVLNFRKVASRLNLTTHQGASISRKNVILNLDFFKAMNCQLPNTDERNLLYFAIKESRSCIKMAYTDERVFLSALENIYINIDNPAMAASNFSNFQHDEQISQYKKAFADFIKDNSNSLMELVKLIAEKIIAKK